MTAATKPTHCFPNATYSFMGRTLPFRCTCGTLALTSADAMHHLDNVYGVPSGATMRNH